MNWRSSMKGVILSHQSWMGSRSQQGFCDALSQTLTAGKSVAMHQTWEHGRGGGAAWFS